MDAISQSSPPVIVIVFHAERWTIRVLHRRDRTQLKISFLQER